MFKPELLPLYQKPKILKFHSIYRLEVITFMIEHKSKKLPALFGNYFTLTSKIYSHITKQANKNNFLRLLCRVTKSSIQQSIKVSGPNLSKTLPG